MLFAILCEDKPDHLPVRLENRPAHVAYLTSLGERLSFAGPFLGEDDKPVGSMLMVDVADADAARAIAAGDPYAKAGLFAKTEIRRWNWTVNNPKA